MSVESDRFKRGLEIWAERERQRTFRPAVMQGRRTESNVDPSQLPVYGHEQLRDPGTGNLFFVIGYSLIDGPDVLA